MYGEVGNDLIYGEASNDQIDGGIGEDWLYGGADLDTLNGFNGNDWLDGGNGSLSRRAHVATAFTTSFHHRKPVAPASSMILTIMFSSNFSMTMTSLLARWVMWITS
ncbi:hypothetical protein HJG54_06165 [Leptolyngbya sp. NK1-12]|uniref:Calcium-binding protein n=1 Tax=Leptolyngbya sp. NK1-12 TaxID=2547451 RepID=A0AA97AJ68_9CYAN|nr:hypothetical protein HJG54_06165 [Leptolyngbya sp. NK1-12]